MRPLEPYHQLGDYVFCQVSDNDFIFEKEYKMVFKEMEGITVICEKQFAEKKSLKFDQVFAWITLRIETSVNDKGLTALFSKQLALNDISCNVIAAFSHDHIFVHKNDLKKTLEIIQKLYF